MKSMLKKTILHLVVIAVVAIAVYYNSLENSFHYDDQPVIIENSLIKNLSNIPRFFLEPVTSSSPKFSGGYRPLTMASFALNYKLGGLSVRGYHVVNIAFHAATAMLVYLLLMALPWNVNNRGRSGKYIPALIVALIFAVHPVNSEAVNYIWQRSVLMSSFFYIAALLLYIKFLNSKKTVFHAISVFSFVLALLSKEIAITLPLVILLYDLYFIKPEKKAGIKGLVKRNAVYFIALLVFLFMRLLSHEAATEFAVSEKPGMMAYFMTQFGVILKYIKLIVLPLGLSVDHSYPVLENMFGIKAIVPVIMISGMLALSIIMKKKDKVISFLLLWFFITLIPTSTVLPLYIIMNEHRVYLPGIGLIAALVMILYGLPRNPKLLGKMAVFCPSLLMVFSIMTYNRNAQWKDEITLWQRTIKTNPGSVKALVNSGIAFKNAGLLDEAISIYNDAISKNPGDAELYNNRGISYWKKGSIELAFADLDRAIELNPVYPEAFRNRGIAFSASGDIAGAIRDYRKAIALNPGFTQAYTELAGIYVEEGRYNEALFLFKKATSMIPDAVNYYNTGNTYEKMGMPGNAIKQYDKALKSANEPGLKSELAYNMGLIKLKSKHYDEAETYFLESINGNPQKREAYQNLGAAYMLNGKPGAAEKICLEAIEMGFKSYEFHYNLGCLYSKQGKYGLAIKEFKNSLNLKPGFREANTNLERLKAAEFTAN